MLDNVGVRSIAKHRNKLMSLVESTKKRKKQQQQQKWSVPPSNIEHLVFKKIPTSPIDNFDGARLDFSDDTRDAEEDDDSEEELVSNTSCITCHDALPLFHTLVGLLCKGFS